ncbi:MAG: 4'-phosphopantetheinyl transferase superfamily protein [Mycoplasma sp.]
MTTISLIHGIDVTSLNRDEFNNPDLINKFLHPKEIKIYNLLSNDKEKKNFLASHWTIKESIFKALKDKKPMSKMLVEKVNDEYIYFENDYEFKISVSYIDDLVFSSVIGWKK